jgi:predicted Fe-Mo cluster-binding NifX family protein
MKRIAIPLVEGKLCLHFGHCQQFGIYDVEEDGRIIASSQTTPPPHEPGVLPRWLHEQGVSLVIAGGMGGRAQELFASNGIEVMVGAPSEAPEALIGSYIQGQLELGGNACSH